MTPATARNIISVVSQPWGWWQYNMSVVLSDVEVLYSPLCVRQLHYTRRNSWSDFDDHWPGSTCALCTCVMYSVQDVGQHSPELCQPSVVCVGPGQCQCPVTDPYSGSHPDLANSDIHGILNKWVLNLITDIRSSPDKNSFDRSRLYCIWRIKGLLCTTEFDTCICIFEWQTNKSHYKRDGT